MQFPITVTRKIMPKVAISNLAKFSFLPSTIAVAFSTVVIGLISRDLVKLPIEEFMMVSSVV